MYRNNWIEGTDHRYFTYRSQLRLADMLFKKLNLKNEISMLSVGCGNGNELRVLNRYGSVDILDIEKDVVSKIPKNLYSSLFIEDICDFKSQKKYDIVVGFEVLEHIQDDKKAVESIHNLLKEGGYFLFTVPSIKALVSAHDKALLHIRRYDKEELKGLITAKFDIIFFSYRYFFILPMVLISKVLNKNANPKIEAPRVPGLINDIILTILMAEILLMERGGSLPFGASVVGIGRKKSDRKNNR